MSDQETLYIEDEQGEKLFYTFTPAAFMSNFIPLIVILESEKKDEVKNFEYKMWNILTPLNYFEHKNRDLLMRLIKERAEEYECEEHIYLYGSSLGDEKEYLIDECKEHKITYHIEDSKRSEDDTDSKLKEVLDTFEKMSSIALYSQQ